MRIRAFPLTLLLARTLAAQQKSRWVRVYTYDDAVIEMEEIQLSFGNFGRRSSTIGGWRAPDSQQSRDLLEIVDDRDADSGSR